MSRAINILFSLLFISITATAQKEYTKWKAIDVSYELGEIQKKKYDWETGALDEIIMSGLKNIYYFTISDLDGDNCPFYPSCSNFFVSAVKQTNIFQGALMFADRFTRDTNLFKSFNQYPYLKHGKLFDPVEIYTLRKNIKVHLPQNSSNNG